MIDGGVTQEIHELRDLINSTVLYKQNIWARKNSGDWNKLWCAIDNAEDTQVAIDEYTELINFSRISVYGLLQSLVVQQDAFLGLEEVLRLKKPDLKSSYPGLYKIRQVRVETVGHPTNTRNENGLSYTSISPTNRRDVLEYGVWSLNGFQHKEINLDDLIATQSELLKIEVKRIMEKISEEEKKHKKQFQDQNLNEILKETSYNIQKLWPFERDRIYSEIMFKSLSDAFAKFKAEVSKRYGFVDFDESINIPGVVLTVEKIDKLLPRVEKMLPMGEDVDSLNLEVYVESLNNSFEELTTMAKEMDNEFENEK